MFKHISLNSTGFSAFNDCVWNCKHLSDEYPVELMYTYTLQVFIILICVSVIQTLYEYCEILENDYQNESLLDCNISLHVARSC